MILSTRAWLARPAVDAGRLPDFSVWTKELHPGGQLATLLAVSVL
jgi:hypothetical protein